MNSRNASKAIPQPPCRTLLLMLPCQAAYMIKNAGEGGRRSVNNPAVGPDTVTPAGYPTRSRRLLLVPCRLPGPVLF